MSKKIIKNENGLFIIYPSNPKKLIKAVELWCECGEENTIRDFYSLERSPTYTCRKCRWGATEVECDYCGDLFFRSPSKMKKSKTGFRFCSRRCKDSAQSIDGINDFTPAHYGTSDQRYRLPALNHHGKSCMKCGDEREYVLVVHHIDGNRKNNDIFNLEVLCMNCHCTKHLKLDPTGNLIYCTSVLTSPEIDHMINPM